MFIWQSSQCLRVLNLRRVLNLQSGQNDYLFDGTDLEILVVISGRDTRPHF